MRGVGFADFIIGVGGGGAGGGGGGGGGLIEPPLELPLHHHALVYSLLFVY